MKWPALLFYFFVFTLPVTHAQVSADSLLKQALATLKRGSADSSIRFQEEALRVFAAQDSLIQWLRCHVSLAYSWAENHKQPFVGLDLVERALRSLPRQPRNREEWEQVCLTYLAKAYIYEQYVDDLAAAKQECERGFQVFEQQLGEHSDKIAGYIYYKYGNLFTRLGDYEHAQVLLQGGIDYASRYNAPEAAKHGDLAIVLLELNKNREALQVIEAGLRHKRNYTEPVITIRYCEAKAQLNLGNVAAARQAADRIPALIARSAKEDEGVNPDYYWAGYYGVLAEIQLALGRYDEAIFQYRKAIRYETLAYESTDRREVGKLYVCIGDVFMKKNQPAEALREYQQALTSVLPKFVPNTDADNPADTLFKAENTILEALEGKARAFLALNNPEKALECYELIPVVETLIRATHAYESSKLLALDESRQRFDAAVAVAWKLHGLTGDSRYIERAFRLTEQARGMLLLQSLAQAQATYNLPDELRRRENELNAKLAWYEHEIADEREAGKKSDAQRLARLEKERFDLKHEIDRFKAELRLRFPDYAALSDRIHFPGWREVFGLLRSDQILLDYYLTADDLFVFSFHPEGRVEWRKASLPAGFRDSMTVAIRYLQKGDEADKAAQTQFRSYAHTLYGLLIEPELKSMAPRSGSLLIIPDDALVFLPFEVLLRESVTRGNWRDLPLLLTDYNTGYAYSAALLQMQQRISRKHRELEKPLPLSYGGFAPSYESSGVYKLTSTDLMVQQGQKLLGGQTWCGTQASEATFKQKAPDCRILLLAMHGIADAEHPELSRLLFGDPGPDSLENNNVLYASELQIMQLQADLAVLSACHSGFGNFRKGEGVFSLARAFARAGVPATFMSLWLLQENAASPLVQSFLENLRKGYSKDEALRLAKLDFLKQDRYFEMGHPFYWAGVTVAGDTCSLELGYPAWMGYVAGLAAALLAVAAWWWFRRRRVNTPSRIF